MSNAELIAEARERAHMYTGGPEADRLWRLADALEAMDTAHTLLRNTVDWLLQDRAELRDEIHQRVDSGYNA